MLCNVHVRLIWIVDMMNFTHTTNSSHDRWHFSTSLSTHSHTHSLKVHSFKHPGSELFNFHRIFYYFYSNKLFTFSILFVKFGKQASNNRITFYLPTMHAYSKRDILWYNSRNYLAFHPQSVYTDMRWKHFKSDGFRRETLSFIRCFFFFPHPFNCRLQTMMSIFILYDYFSFYLLDFFLHSIPFFFARSRSLRTLFAVVFSIRFFVWDGKKRELNKAHWILLKALHLDSVWNSDVSLFSCVYVRCECYLTDLSRRLSSALCEKVTKNYNNSNIIL